MMSAAAKLDEDIDPTIRRVLQGKSEATRKELWSIIEETNIGNCHPKESQVGLQIWKLWDQYCLAMAESSHNARLGKSATNAWRMSQGKHLARADDASGLPEIFKTGWNALKKCHGHFTSQASAPQHNIKRHL